MEAKFLASPYIRPPLMSLGVIGLLVLGALITCIVTIAAKRHIVATERTSSVALARRTGAPARFTTNPLSDFNVSNEWRRFCLDQITSAAHSKGMSYEPIAVHCLRLHDIAHHTDGFEHTAFYDETLRLLTDDRAFRKHGTRMPLLVDTAYGASYRTRPREEINPSLQLEMIGGITHVDKVLSALGELGLPLETKVITNSHSVYTLADVLEDSLQRFSYKRELEWSVIAYCDYLCEQNQWVTSRGDIITIDDIVNALLDRPEHQSACAGTHRLYAIAKACMKERCSPGFIRQRTAKRAESYLVQLSARLEVLQSADGSWDRSWIVSQNDSHVAGEDDEECLLVTGHMLEWMAIVGSDLRPHPEVIRCAAEFIQFKFRTEADQICDKHLLPATHAFRAIVNLSAAHSRGSK